MRKLRREMDFWRADKKQRRAKILERVKVFVLSSVLLAAMIGTSVAMDGPCELKCAPNERAAQLKRNLYPTTRPLEALIEDKMPDADVSKSNSRTERRPRAERGN